MNEASILHVDMDAFFASVELARRPELRGRPVVVGGQDRSVVLAATYEARVFGLHSAMPMAQALRRCPQVVVIPPDHRLYRQVSSRIMEMFGDITPLVEQISVDEAFLDVSGARRRLGSPETIGASIRAQVAARHRITCSVGIASGKSVAKIASGRAKPDGMLLVPSEATVEFLHPLDVRSLWGVGERTAAALARWGVRTVGDLAHLDRGALHRAVGQAVGDHLHEMAWGRDPRPVTTVRAEKSVGVETTFSADVADPVELNRTLLELSDRCAGRARAAGVVGRVVSLKVRTADFVTANRSRTLEVPTDVAREIHTVSRELLAGVERSGRPVRLLGVRLEQLAPYAGTPVQGTFDEEPPARRDAEVVADRVRARFGPSAVRAASLLDPAPTAPSASGATR